MTQEQGDQIIQLLTQANTLLEASGIALGHICGMVTVCALLLVVVVFFQAKRPHS